MRVAVLRRRGLQNHRSAWFLPFSPGRQAPRWEGAASLCRLCPVSGETHGSRLLLRPGAAVSLISESANWRSVSMRCWTVPLAKDPRRIVRTFHVGRAGAPGGAMTWKKRHAPGMTAGRPSVAIRGRQPDASILLHLDLGQGEPLKSSGPERRAGRAHQSIRDQCATPIQVRLMVLISERRTIKYSPLIG